MLLRIASAPLIHTKSWLLVTYLDELQDGGFQFAHAGDNFSR
jgi:hypothetical protein